MAIPQKLESDGKNEPSKPFDLYGRLIQFPYKHNNLEQFLRYSTSDIAKNDLNAAVVETYERMLSIYPEIEKINGVQVLSDDDQHTLMDKLPILWKYIHAKKASPTIFPEIVDNNGKWKIYFEENPERLIEIYDLYVENIGSTSRVESTSIGSQRLNELPTIVLEQLVDPDSKKYNEAAELLVGERSVAFAEAITEHFANSSLRDVTNIQVAGNGDQIGECNLSFEGREVVVPIYIKNTSNDYRNKQSPQKQLEQFQKEVLFTNSWKQIDPDQFYKTSALPVSKDGVLPSIWMIDLYKLGYVDMRNISDAVNTCTPLGLAHILQMFTTATAWMSDIEKFYTPVDIWCKGMVFMPNSPTQIRTFDYGNFDPKVSGVYRGLNFFDNSSLPPQEVPILAYRGLEDYPNPYLVGRFYRALERAKQGGKLTKWSDIADLFFYENINLPETLNEITTYERYPKIVTADRVLRSLVKNMSDKDIESAIDQSYASDLPLSAQSHSIALWICIKKGFSNRFICPVANYLGLSVNQTINLIEDWSKINLSSVVDEIKSRLTNVLS